MDKKENILKQSGFHDKETGAVLPYKEYATSDEDSEIPTTEENSEAEIPSDDEFKITTIPVPSQIYEGVIEAMKSSRNPYLKSLHKFLTFIATK